MLGSNFTYSLREAGRHFHRNLSTCIGAVVTIFLSLFIIGVFVFGSAIVQNILGSAEDQVTIQAFLSDNATPEQIEALQNQVKSWPNVQSVIYKNKEEAYKEYKERVSEDIVNAIDSNKNPLPGSLEIQLQEPSQVEETAVRLKNDAEYQKIADEGNAEKSVLYGQGYVEKLFAIIKYVNLAGVILVSLLTFVAFVFINNTIRLAISARRREIAIERLVGASNSFIRGPFLMEGALESLIGALLAILGLQLLRAYAMPVVQNAMPFLPFTLPGNVVTWTYVGLISIGLIIGLFGSAIAMRRYLRV